MWLAFAPVWRWVLGLVVGKRNQASVNRLLGPVAQVTDARLLPLVTSDRWAAYPQALLMTCGAWDCPPRRGTRGAHPKPRLRPRADLWYAQVIKLRHRGRVIAVRTQMVFGAPAMAAGITDHLWTVRELLSYRVSPLYWQEQPLLEKLFPSWPEIHHGS